MTVDFDSGTGLFDRLGKLLDAVNRLNTFLAGSGAGTMPGELLELVAKYDGATLKARKTIDELPQAVEDFRDTNTLTALYQQAAAETLIEMMHADNPLPFLDTSTAIEELIRQMKGASETVKAGAPTLAVVADAGNSGNGILFGTLLNGKGETMENSLAEDLVLEITDDTTRSAESGTLAGEVDTSNGDTLSPLWPSGSGAQVLITAEASEDGLLSNGGFEESPFFDGWTTVSGAPVTSADSHRGTVAASFPAGAHEHTQDVSGVDWQGLSQYPVAVALKASAALTGTLVLDLYDEDAAAAVVDELGNASELSIDLSTVPTANYSIYKGFLRIPSPVPETVTFRIRTTANIVGGSLLVDDVLLGEAKLPVYAGGPTFAFVPGSNDAGLGDRWVATVGNTYGGFQQGFHRMFDDPGLLLPSASSPSIPDSLIN